MSSPGSLRFGQLNVKPSPPPLGYDLIYVRTDDVLYMQDSAGVEVALGSASAITQLTGDVTAVGPGIVSAVISSVGGQSALNIASATTAYLAATSANTALTLVKRDASGNFSAGTITSALIGNVTGNVTGNLTGDVFGGTITGLIHTVGFQRTVSLKTSSYTATIHDGMIEVDAVGGPVVITLPSAVTSNQYTITKVDSSANTVTVVPTVPDNISGNPSIVLHNQYDTYTLVGDGLGLGEYYIEAAIIAGTGPLTALTGDVSALGPGSAVATVNSVGGQSASAVAFAATQVAAANSSGTPNTLVKTDGSGNFSASTITATLNGNASNVTATTNSTLTTLSSLSLPGSQVTGNISGDAGNITGIVAIINGGTGQTTANASFDALSPMTTAGDLVYENATPTATRLPIGSVGQVLTVSGGLPVWAAPATSGTVTSVALSDGSAIPIYSISGSPVTSTGTLTLTLSTQSANTFFAGPTTGSAAQPTFRSIVASDVPTLNQNTTGTAANITATSNSTLTTLSSLSLPGSQVTGNISGNAAGFTGSLSGDVTGTQGATAISSTTVTSKLLTGYVTGTNTPLVASNSILTAFENLQAQISATVGAAITSLTGDVSATGPGSAAATVNSVGGQSASAVAFAATQVAAATSTNTASTLVLRNASGNFSANVITATLNGNASTATSAISFTGPLLGDVTGTQSATVVSFVGGYSAAAVGTSVLDTQSATSSNTASTIVKRDASGNFSAGTITASLLGNVTGNVSGSSSSFTGALLGDVTGTQSATSVVRIQGISVNSTAPTDAQFLVYQSGITAYKPVSMSGDVTITDLGVASLVATTNSTLTTLSALSLPASQITGTLPIANGGTGQTTANAAFNALSPMTTLGDIIYENATPAAARLPGNTTSVREFLTSQGSGGLATAPLWSALVSGDIPNNGANTTGTASNITASSNSTLTTLTALSLPGSQVTGNIPGNAANVTGVVAILNGGTGQTTAAAAFNALSPLITAGDLIYELSAGTAARLPIGSAGNVLTVVAGEPAWAAPATSGTVTSVGLSLPSIFNVTGTPVTSSGTLTATFNTETANTVFAGPASGGAATPTFRALVSADIPAINLAASGNGGVTGVLPVANGGTNLSTTPSNGQILIGNGTNYTLGTLTAGTGIAITNASGTITVANNQTSPFVTKTANYTILSTDGIIFCDTSGGAFTLTLPSPTALGGKIYRIIDTKGFFQSNNLTLAPSGAEKIEGLAASKVLRTPWGWFTVTTDSTDWYVG